MKPAAVVAMPGPPRVLAEGMELAAAGGGRKERLEEGRVLRERVLQVAGLLPVERMRPAAAGGLEAIAAESGGGERDCWRKGHWPRFPNRYE